MYIQQGWRGRRLRGRRRQPYCVQRFDIILYPLFSGLAMLYIYIIYIYIYMYIYICIHIIYILAKYMIFRSMSKSLSFAKSKILTKTLCFLRPMVTSYGHFKFGHIQVPNKNHTVPLYTDPLYDSQRDVGTSKMGCFV